MARLDAAISSLFLAKAVLCYGARYQAAHDMMTTTGFCYACDLHQAALHNQRVGWVERSDSHQSLRGSAMGVAEPVITARAQLRSSLGARSRDLLALLILRCYVATYPNNPFPGT
jgi:hypothetical protein